MTDATSNHEPGVGPLSIDVARDGVATVVTVRGEVDLETSGELSAALAGIDPGTEVHVDLAAVEYLDSSGLRVLLTAKDDLARDGGILRVTAVSNIVARLIEITGVDDLLS
jgi:anti-sigma B factor antagonist